MGQLRLRDRARWSVVVAAAGFVLSGCSPQGAGATLEERTKEYWELRQAKRWEDVYDRYLDPERREVLPKAAFLKKRLLAFDVLSFEIAETEENGEQATVSVRSEANIPVRGLKGAVRLIRKTVTAEDEWVRRGGVWYVRLSE